MHFADPPNRVLALITFYSCSTGYSRPSEGQDADLSKRSVSTVDWSLFENSLKVELDHLRE
jgi:hypothetical protein